MKNPLNELLSHLNMNRLCTDCENWTQDECEECDEPFCEDCVQWHMNVHYQDQDDEEK